MIKMMEWAQQMSIEELTSKLEDTNIWDRLDLGSVLLLYGDHALEGPTIFLSTVCGKAAQIHL